MQIQTRQIRFKGWMAILTALALFLAVGAAFAILAVGFFLFLLPAMLIATGIYYLLPKASHSRRDAGMRQPDIIEGEYRVLDAPEDGQKR